LKSAYLSFLIQFHFEQFTSVAIGSLFGTFIAFCAQTFASNLVFSSSYAFINKSCIIISSDNNLLFQTNYAYIFIYLMSFLCWIVRRSFVR
ncbi:hypothetical protein T03_14461, partial [Trichinella britovi]